MKPSTLHWLLDKDDPGPRYLALRDLADMPEDDRELAEARMLAHKNGPINTIINEMHPDGYWVEPGPGYSPKYRGTVWSIILLAQLGAHASLDSRITKACNYLLDHALTEYGQFSVSGTPGSTIDCLQGNLCSAMLDLGINDQRIDKAFEWMARSLTGEGVAPMGDKSTQMRYYSGNCGPGFACGANNKQPCAWGAVKVMLAFGKLPVKNRIPLIEKAIDRGVRFLFSCDPFESNYPSGWNEKPSRNWWNFGFPVFYVTDLLQNTEALIRLGYGKDPRLQRALKFIYNEQNSEGRWLLKYDYSGKVWGNFGRKKETNKWVTIRAKSVLKDAHFVAD